MSRVHDAVRRLEQRNGPEGGPGGALSNLVGALIQELADEIPDDPYLETVRTDLQAASRQYETGSKKDLALRFYLATRSLLREHAILQERLRQAEASKTNQIYEYGNLENAPSAPQ